MDAETRKFIVDLATIAAPIILALIAFAQVILLRTQREIHAAVNSAASLLVTKNAAELASEKAKVEALTVTLATAAIAAIPTVPVPPPPTDGLILP